MYIVVEDKANIIIGVNRIACLLVTGTGLSVVKCFIAGYGVA